MKIFKTIYVLNKNQIMTDRTFSSSSNQNLAGFVPALVIDYLLEKLRRKEPRKLPEKQSFDSVVMFADISGFTNLAEKLSKKGPEGTELLAFTLNRYMELLVNGISRSGGDIFKFAGDAMIIVWPPPNNNNSEELTILCRQAIQSALDIQSKLTDFKIIDEVKLSVKIGFGVGQVTIAHVGGVFQRAEYLPAGSPLTQAFECEHLAPGGGVVIVSKQIWERCFNFFEFDQITDLHNYKGENSPFFYVTKVKKTVKMKADAFLIKNKLKPGDLEAIRNSLKSYIPAAIVPFIEIDQEKWSAELRRLSVLFVNLGIDLKDTQTQVGLERIQVVIECVQRCVYSNQGSLNKFLMDDKGSTLMVVFGLYPMGHQDDPVRAVLTAINLVNELKPIKCSCSVGITTGMVFAGVVGTSGNRREYSVLGDSVNLSARFMQAACQEQEKKIMVDEVTKLEAEHKLRFRFVKKSQVKGKTGEISFFEPIEEDVMSGENRIFSSETKSTRINLDKIKIHEVNGWENKKIIGKSYEEEATKAMTLLEKFLNKPLKNGLVMILGSYGAGKSLLVTEIIEKMGSRIELDNWKYNEKISIYANSLNNVEKSKKLNGWRRIFQEILIRLSLRLKQNSEAVLYKILEKNEELIENLHLVQDILNIKTRTSTQGTNKSKFIQRGQEIYEKKMIKKILIKILLKYLEEDEDITDNSIELSVHKSTSILLSNNLASDMLKNRKADNSSIPAPLIVILDDMQDYDYLSWELSFKILRKAKKIFIFACIRNKYIELPPLFKKPDLSSAKEKGGNESSTTHGSHRKTISNVKPTGLSESNNQEELVDSGIFEFEEICENSFFHKIDLKGLEKKEIELLVMKFLGIKKIELAFEGNNVDENMNSKEKLYQFLYDKTEGVPLDILHLSEKIISSGYGFISDERKTLVLKKDLKKMIEINEFLTLDTPLCRVKVNGPMIDRLSCANLLVMKAASVIGDCFDIQTLLKLNPFKSSIPSEKVRSIVTELEHLDFLEILDEQATNIRYRFTSPFMRESIYQRMTYNQRRVLHRYVAEAIQAIPLTSVSVGEEKLECDRLIYHWCLAENKDPFIQNNMQDPVTDFSNKAKRSIIVKKISSLLSKNPNNLSVVIKKGNLEKKSDRGFKWSTRYCLMTTREFKYYYTEEDFARNSSVDEALGTIPFKNIFQIMPLKETESKGKKNAFVIYVGSWQKKDKDMGLREFYFSAVSNDELEQWTTYMEFIRAKAIYDQFVNTFGKISFPLTNNTALEKIDSLEDPIKGSQGMSRLAFMTQKNDVNHSSFLNTYKSHNSSIRKTTFKPMNLKDKQKKDLMMNEYKESNNNETIISNYNAECHKKLKDRLLQFFQSSLFLFWSHVFEMSSRNSRKLDSQKTDNFMILGNNTSFMKERNHHFFFERSLFDDVAPPQFLLDKRISKYHTSFSLNGRSSNASMIYNSIDSLEDVNNNSPAIDKDKKPTNSNFGIGSGNTTNNPLVRQLTAVDENISEELISPQVKFKKSILLKGDEKGNIQQQNDANVMKKSQLIEEGKLESLEKIEEVSETRDSLMTSDNNLDFSRDKERGSFSIPKEASLVPRKSKFLNMMPIIPENPMNKNMENSKENNFLDELSKIEQSLNYIPENPKIKTNMDFKMGEVHKYIGNKEENFEVVVKTKKGNNATSKNENYGDLLFKKYLKNDLIVPKNEHDVSPLSSLSNIEDKQDTSLKELLRDSFQKIKEKEENSQKSKKSIKSQSNTTSLFNPSILKKPDKNDNNDMKAKDLSLEKWEKSNFPNPNEESLYQKPSLFSDKDFEYSEYPHNLSKQAKYFKNDSSKPNDFMSSIIKKPEADEEIVVKKKKKDFSQYDTNQKSLLSDEDRVYFKDYDTLSKSSLWNSKKEKEGVGRNKQEKIEGNLNYASVRNFQSKKFKY